MATMNDVKLIGNLTRDVELKYLPSGTAVTDLRLAVNDRRKNKETGELIEDTLFIDATLWGRTAEVAAEYLSKGSPVLIEGQLKMDEWEDKETGEKRTKIKVNANRMQMLSSAGGDTTTSNTTSTSEEPVAAAVGGDDDVPF